MLGKTVRLRHCPATVSGQCSTRHLSLPRIEPEREGRCTSGRRKSGDRFSQSIKRFSEGEKIMVVLAFLVFLFSPPSEVLKGSILDPTGAAITGARVEISRSGSSRTAASNESGVFSIEDVQAGAYALHVKAN